MVSSMPMIHQKKEAKNLNEMKNYVWFPAKKSFD